ncbi:MAG: 3-phosphoshikimate 1-carboxyvinyltransferase [Acidobacteria bacterium]|nr:3-phosphoshikimate 1-carboxyvinyltransferase [Acidobacteriota bacterium]
MQEVITPAGRLRGVLSVPGDKSISHRYAMLASVAEGVSIIQNYSSGADCHSTLACIRGLGIDVLVEGRTVTVHGRGLHGYRAPSADLDAGNSGSTIRMLSGLLAGQRFKCRLVGDESLSQRPMQRIMGPLAQMGAKLSAREGKFPPLEIEGGELVPLDYVMPVASAQVKSCVLLAGLHAAGETTVREPAATRDHTEVALREFGAEIHRGDGWAKVKGPARLRPLHLRAPGDLSSAAFFLVAGAAVPGSNLVIEGVGVNPTRAALIDFLASAGAQVRVLNSGLRSGEPSGDLEVSGSRLKGGLIDGRLAAALIDEIPVLAVLGAVSEEGLTVRDAAELRIKETDRIEAVAGNMRRMGVQIETFDDGFHIPGGQRFRSGTVLSQGDHRIAMAFAVAALMADGPVTIEGSEAASVSFPESWSTLRGIVG